MLCLKYKGEKAPFFNFNTSLNNLRKILFINNKKLNLYKIIQLFRGVIIYIKQYLQNYSCYINLSRTQVSNEKKIFFLQKNKKIETMLTYCCHLSLLILHYK